jgi:hypothetical protein
MSRVGLRQYPDAQGGRLGPVVPVEAFVGTELSACSGCTVGRARGLVPAAVAVSNFPGASRTSPAGESETPIPSGVVGLPSVPEFAPVSETKVGRGYDAWG